MSSELVAQQDDTGIVPMLKELASNPNLPVENLRVILDMQMKVRDRMAEEAFAAAMVEVQAEIPTIGKNKRNNHTNSGYADYEAIAREVKPILGAHGLSVSFSQGETPKPDCLRVVGTVRHRAGHSETHYIDIPMDGKGIAGKDNKTATHATGSTFTYGKRYLLCLIFDIATGNDTDGNATDPTISVPQQEMMTKLLKESGADFAKFLEVADVDRLDEVRTSKFDGLMNLLKQKKAQKEKDAAK